MDKKAIICVDDEKTVLASIKTQLKNNFGDKYLYEMADNAKEALEVIDELIADGTKIILIVSDWLMPGMKGDEFLIKVHEKYPNIITVMLTGQANEESIEKARVEAGLFACLYKPWSAEDLVNVINMATKKI